MSDKRVLVVDDDAAIRQMFITLLRRNGYVVDAVHDGNEGLSRIRSCEYCAVILDLMMPITSGFEMLDILEREKPHALQRVIVTTGASRNDLSKLDSSRVFALIRKPFDIHELLRKVEECSEKLNLVR
ncbi:MAG TPA: response regulator [Thermoanaerobaculia bacterium]|nr:response regulator [Thermoanaerobaculia bacterium]